MSPLRVLVADDDEDVLDVARFALSGQFEMLLASTGEEAFATAIAESPDVLVLDYNLPGIDGAEVVRALRRLHRNIPAILVSGARELGGVAASLGIPYLAKPCSMHELAMMIRDQSRVP